MRRHIAQPLDAGWLRWGVGVQPPGDGVGDDGLALLLEQVDQALLFGHEGVDLGGLTVEEGGDEYLLRGRWERSPFI